MIRVTENGRMDIAEARSSPVERERIANLMEMVPAGVLTALDVGARDGFLSVALTEKANRVFALDLVPPVVSHPQVEAVTGDATQLAFADETFDLVLCAEVLEHFESPTLEKICAELVRVSRRYVLIGVPFEQDTRLGRLTCQACGHHDPPWGHVSTFDERRLRDLFAGLDVERVCLVGSHRNRTNFISATLSDWAGNPWGPYSQEECCTVCGARFVRPGRRGLLQRIATRSAHLINIAQQFWLTPRPTWIHVLYARKRAE
jgi:hypothetical protein